MINSKQREFNDVLEMLDASLDLLDEVQGGLYLRVISEAVKDARKVLLNNAEEISTLAKKTLLLQEDYDTLIFALLATGEASSIGISEVNATEPLTIDDAVSIIERMNHRLREQQILDEIPFGAVEEDRELTWLAHRVDELEMQLKDREDDLRNLQQVALQSSAAIVAQVMQGVAP